MNWRNMIRGIIGAPKKGRFDKPIRPKPDITRFEPATPEPTYICENCGMLINTGHKHTREECKGYKESPITPDNTLRKVMVEKYPARNDPTVRLPYYYDTLSETKIKEKVKNENE